LSSLRDEAREGPFVRLAEWRRFPGQTVRVKGMAVRTLAAVTNKKTPLRVTVEVEDGSGEPLRARLSDDMIERVLGMAPTAFRALHDRDRAQANEVLARLGPLVYNLEGVLTLRLPSSALAASSAPSQPEGGGAQPQQPQSQPQPTAVLLSCEDPTWDDARALVRLCGVRLGMGEADGGSNDGGGGGAAWEKDEEVIVLSGGD
jgi:hypothetical protein